MSTEQRTSYRCPTVAPQQQAVLQVGRNQLIVELLDQSAGGFAIRSLGSIPLQSGQVVALRTQMGWSEVEVEHVEAEQEATRIGLRRLGELPDPRVTNALYRTSWPQLLGGRSLQSSGSPLACLLALFLFLVIGFWVVVSHSVWLPRLQQFWKPKPSPSTSRADTHSLP